MGLKRGAIGNTLEEHIGKLKGTCWKNPTQNFKGKKSRHLGCMLQPTHWLHLFLISKTIGHHFWPRLMVGAEIEQGRKTNNNSPQPFQKEKTRAIMSAC